LRHDRFDLVLVDTISLHEDGSAFIRRLRSVRGTPLVALTESHCDDRVRAFDLGADDAIAQPVDRDELRARITAVIRRHKGHSQSLLQAGVLTLSIDTREVCIRDRRKFGGQAAIALTAQRTWSRRLAPRRDQRICWDLFIRRFTRKWAVSSVIAVPTLNPARWRSGPCTPKLVGVDGPTASSANVSVRRWTCSGVAVDRRYFG